VVGEIFKKNVLNETIKRLSVGNTKMNILTNQGQLRLRSFTKSYEVRRILLMKTAVKVKIVNFYVAN